MSDDPVMSNDLLLSSDETLTALIAGETFPAKPVTFSVVTESDPDSGEEVRLAMFEGCIVLGTVEEVESGSVSLRPAVDDPDGVEHGVGITGRRFRWPAGVVPYEIHSGLTNQARVTNAINHWQQRTRIRFVRRTSANASASRTGSGSGRPTAAGRTSACGAAVRTSGWPPAADSVRPSTRSAMRWACGTSRAAKTATTSSGLTSRTSRRAGSTTSTSTSPTATTTAATTTARSCTTDRRRSAATVGRRSSRCSRA